MNLRLVSDFHTEFFGTASAGKFERILERYFPAAPEDAEQILICAGDMGKMQEYDTTYKKLFKILGDRFKEVICVPGNHSWYSTIGVWGKESEFWREKKLPDNVHYLDNRFIIIDDVVFIGSCLWTSFDNLNPVAMHHASKVMNDFHTIKTGYRVQEGPYVNSQTARLTPEQTVERHKESVEYLRDTLEMFRGNKCVVVTHHAPCSQSVHSYYKGDILNAAYYTDLSELILEYQPYLWVHGHMHETMSYKIGETNVCVNALGYHASSLNYKFEKMAVVEI